MSVFSNSLKTFESDILGYKKKFKINNAVWLYLESEYDMSQKDFSEKQAEAPDLTAAKFFHCVLKANKIETTLEDIVSNTDPVALQEFTWAYNDVVNEGMNKAVKERLGKMKEAGMNLEELIGTGSTTTAEADSE